MTTISVTLQLIIGYVNQFTELNMLMLHITPHCSQNTALWPHSKLHKLQLICGDYLDICGNEQVNRPLASYRPKREVHLELWKNRFYYLQV